MDKGGRTKKGTISATLKDDISGKKKKEISKQNKADTGKKVSSVKSVGKAKSDLTIEIAEIFKPLLSEKWRIKFYYGGRGGGKSYAFADSLLLLARQKKLFIACLREIQDSIKESVYKLLCDRISAWELNDYKIYESRIENRLTGSKFIFRGLRDQDVNNIKSLEGVDIAWIEEAHTITKKSWSILSPTIRKNGSEIWISMNREEENDPLWVLLASKPDERTLVRKVNYYDNPFCPEELKIQAKQCQKDNPEDYEHIWLGEPIRQGDYKLISSQKVRDAFTRKIDASTSPLVIGLDIARFGDDQTSFCFRKGRFCLKFLAYKKLDNVAVANLATNIIRELKPYRIFMDVGGQGAGVYDILKDRGYGEIIRGIYFGEKALNENRYFNRRAEMWDAIREWLDSKPAVQLPQDEELFDDLTSINKKYDRKGRLCLEEKDELKKRLGRSPDKGDALALTFAEPVYDVGEPRLYGNGNLTYNDLFSSKKENTEW
ncbi:MAG: PBSX family phage terminase large subunit [Alphaproteobacteria bacterium]|nr:PBSX family phage terminase large subunit [Alphaproteobacteria bacterium]